MSLHALANNMAARGRGPDSMLVHMAPREVAGLQSLAMAHGGSLTINPATGLPEAGFLSNLLPTLIGGALTVASGGALSPLMAGLITGAGYGVASGSLSKGLMAGLGAFGGAGLGAGLSAAGAAEAAVPGAASVAPEATTAFTTDPSAYSKFAPTESSLGAFGEAKGALASAPTGGVSPLFGTATDVASQPLGFEAAAPTPTTPMATPTATPAPSSYAPAYGTETAKNAFQAQAADATMTDNFKQAGRGLTSLFESPAGRDAFLGQAAEKGGEATGVGGLGGLAKYGAAAAAPALLAPPSGPTYKPDTEQHKYKYDVNRNPDPQGTYTGAPTGERQWFTPTFTRMYADGGQTQSSEDALKYLTSTDTTGRTNDLTGASRQAYDYLMGNGPGYRPQIQTQSALPQARYLGPNGIADIPTDTPVAPVVPFTPVTPEPPTFDVTPEPDYVPPEPEPDTPSVDSDFPATPVPPYVEPEINHDDLSVRTDPIVSDIPDTAVNPADIPLITPTTPLELPELPTTTELQDKSYIDEVNAPDIVGPTRGGGGDLPEEFDQYVQPEVTAKTVETPDGGATVTLPADTAVAQPDGSATVNMPEAQAPVAEQPVVQDTPDGGAVITMPETPSVPDNAYVDVGNATGDYGDYGGSNITPDEIAGLNFGASDDFGKYGLGVSGYGGSKGDRFLSAQEDFGNGEYGFMGAATGGLMAAHYAMGGSTLGGYSDGGRLLKGPGDGVSDSIPATIGHKQPARLADGEFVIPARIVSELGNGSTDAGARKLYAMMDRIQAARKKTVGKNRVAVNSRADKMMPV